MEFIGGIRMLIGSSKIAVSAHAQYEFGQHTDKCRNIHCGMLMVLRCIMGLVSKG